MATSTQPLRRPFAPDAIRASSANHGSNSTELDAATLRLGPDYAAINAQPLFLSDLHTRLAPLKQHRVMVHGDRALSEVFVKAFGHSETFLRFRSAELVAQVKVIVSAADESATAVLDGGADGDDETSPAATTIVQTRPLLEPFEQAQLANLCCEEFDEAVTLIPSLARYSFPLDVPESSIPYSLRQQRNQLNGMIKDLVMVKRGQAMV